MKNNVNVEYQQGKLLKKTIKYGAYIELELECPYISRTALPANFVMIKGWKNNDPILPRPFDIVECNPDRGIFKVLIKIKGHGTLRFSEMNPGDYISILGPLGKAVEIPEKTRAGIPVKNIGLLTRGVGSAAVVYLAKKANEKCISVHTFLSAANRENLVCIDYLDKYSSSLHTVCDDDQQNINDGRSLLKKYISKEKLEIVYTCGSQRFSRYVQALDKENTVDGYLFTESRMACGLGNCHGCTITTQDDDYILVCQDGPVFPAGKIKLL